MGSTYPTAALSQSMKKTWPLDVSVSFDPYAGEPDRDGIQGYEIMPDGRVHFRIVF